jgi:hypothetical protein
MEHPKRPVLAQFFINFRLTVGTSPTPINQAAAQAGLDWLADAMIISVPVAAAVPVYFGGAGVNAVTPNGLEIRQGIPVMLSIRNERPLYEVQAPLVDMECATPEVIPFAVWELSTCYLVATAAVGVGVLIFKAPYL